MAKLDYHGLVSAAEEWTKALASWAIPEEILSRAPESPWTLPPWHFVEKARSTLGSAPSATHRRALDALFPGAALLDVGCGAGATSLPLVPPAGSLVAVDQSREMLAELAELARGRVAVTLVEGTWPEVAGQVPEVDVTVCANVAYNVPALDRFVVALTEKARYRVVLELTPCHPQEEVSWLWQHFWQLDRPTAPTAQDAAEVVGEALSVEVGVERWTEPWATRLDAASVAWVRRRLCLPASRDQEVRELLASRPQSLGTEMVTLWWPGAARRA